MECLDSLYDARPPPRWVKISWVSPTSGLWMTSFLERVEQLTVWLTKGRPPAFWLTGFFNPNGFLTATLQDVARKHQGWALDEVVMYSEVTKNNPAHGQGPAFIHLFKNFVSTFLHVIDLAHSFN